MRRRHVILLFGLASAGAIAAFGDRAPVSPISAADTRRAGPGAAQRESSKPQRRPSTAVASVDLVQVPIRRDRESLENLANGSAGLFASRSWVPPPPATPSPEKPTAPPLTFKYLGKAHEQGNWTVFLLHGDSTWVVKTGDQIGNEYRIEAISPPAMTVRYLPMNELQTLSIE